MNFNKHSDLEGLHAFLGASKYHWINYDEEKVIFAYKRWQATMKGAELHEFACRCIQLGIKLQKSKSTLNMYINDAIGYKMTPEQILYYSPNCFGTADTISFRQNFLRVHDYKSGEIPASMHQLEIYAGLFCLEYMIKPSSIDIELRLYQADEILVNIPGAEVIEGIMDKMVMFSRVVDKLRLEE